MLRGIIKELREQLRTANAATIAAQCAVRAADNTRDAAQLKYNTRANEMQRRVEELEEENYALRAEIENAKRRRFY